MVYLHSLLLSLAAVSCYADSIADTLPLNCESGIMTTPTYGTTGGVFTICAQNIINAPKHLIYQTLLDFPKYPAWNTFLYAIDLPANVTSAKDVYVGLPMLFHTQGLIPGVNTTSNEVVTFLEPHTRPAFTAWAFSGSALVDAVMQAEHPSVLRDLGNGSTSYVSWETYYGVGALAVLALKDNLQTQYEVQATELKARVEGIQSTC